MKQKYHVKLSAAERKQIKKHRQSNKHSMESKKRACVLLDLDESDGKQVAPTKTIAARHGVSELSVRRYRQQFATMGLDSAITRKKRSSPPVAAKVTGEVEAYIIATCCSTPPDGRASWTMQMIADKIVLDGIVESLSGESVRRVLKKQNSSHT